MVGLLFGVLLLSALKPCPPRPAPGAKTLKTRRERVGTEQFSTVGQYKEVGSPWLEFAKFVKYSAGSREAVQCKAGMTANQASSEW